MLNRKKLKLLQQLLTAIKLTTTDVFKRNLGRVDQFSILTLSSLKKFKKIEIVYTLAASLISSLTLINRFAKT